MLSHERQSKHCSSRRPHPHPPPPPPTHHPHPTTHTLSLSHTQSHHHPPRIPFSTFARHLFCLEDVLDHARRRRICSLTERCHLWAVQPQAPSAARKPPAVRLVPQCRDVQPRATTRMRKTYWSKQDASGTQALPSKREHMRAASQHETAAKVACASRTGSGPSQHRAAAHCGRSQDSGSGRMRSWSMSLGGQQLLGDGQRLDAKRAARGAEAGASAERGGMHLAGGQAPPQRAQVVLRLLEGPGAGNGHGALPHAPVDCYLRADRHPIDIGRVPRVGGGGGGQALML